MSTCSTQERKFSKPMGKDSSSIMEPLDPENTTITLHDLTD
ncbi:unnamed protein product [Rhodiola kirilowii]